MEASRNFSIALAKDALSACRLVVAVAPPVAGSGQVVGGIGGGVGAVVGGMGLLLFGFPSQLDCLLGTATNSQLPFYYSFSSLAPNIS